MTPLEFLGWILIGGVGLILAALFVAVAIGIVRGALRVTIKPKDHE